MPWHEAIQKVGHSVRSLIHSERHSAAKKYDACEGYCNEATIHLERYLDTRDPGALRASIDFLGKAKDELDEQPSLLTTKRHDSVTEWLHSIVRSKAEQLRLLFHETDEPTYLDESISDLKTLYKRYQKATPEKFAEAIALAQYLSDRYFLQLESDQADWNAAVDAARFALSTSKSLQASILQADKVAARYFEVVGWLAKGSADVVKGMYCYEWGKVLQNRSTWRQDASILKTALDYHTQAIRLLPPTHPLQVANAVQLATCEGELLKFSTDTSRVKETLKLLSEIRLDEASTEDHIRLKIATSELFQGNFSHLSTARDLDCAIDTAKEATEIVTMDTTLHIAAMGNLATYLGIRARMQHSQLDMDLAIRNAQEVLGNLLGIEWSVFRKVENISASVKYLRLALDILPQEHASRAMALHNLCLGLGDQYKYTGGVHVLDEMIEVERLALAANEKPSTNKAIILHELSGILEDRYQRTANSQDLQESISYAEMALSMTSKSSRRYSTYLEGLASRLASSFRRYSRTEDLDRAIALASEAILCAGSNRQSVLHGKTQLASCLEQRFEKNRNPKDIDQAIDLMRDVIIRSAASQPRWLCQLAMCLQTRIQVTANIKKKSELLDEAVVNQSRAISLQSDTDPDQAWYLYLLGTLNLEYIDLLPKSQDNKLSQEAIYADCAKTFEKAFAFQQATPISRVHIARRAGSCYMILEEWKRSSIILTESILLFPKISPLALDQDDRQRKLRGMTEQSTLACIAYVKMGEPALGIEKMDAGRGIMGKLAIRQHDHLPFLRTLNPSLHQQYIELREILSTPVRDNEDRSQDLIAKRQRDQVSFENAEDQIRQLPGMKNFNKSLSAREIQGLAKEGPLVCFCDADDEIFALIVTEINVKVVQLPGLSRPEIDKRVPYIIGDNRLSLWPLSKRAAAVKKMKELLGWLWDAAVRPILTSLDFLGTNKSVLPRIWWITSGHLGLMPLHAAGKGSRRNLENTYDHVVSSYVSTCAALEFARQCQSKIKGRHLNVTLTSMPNTSGRDPLRTAEEDQAVRDAFSAPAPTNMTTKLTELIQPSAAQVLDAVRNDHTDIFHVCCHIEPNLVDPSKTALLFGQNPSDPLPDRLTVAQLREYSPSYNVDTRIPQLAYLSGCCTAQQYDLKLLDESIHLASIFQLIGFPAVIGTLWEADDKPAVFIAKVFYSELIRLRNANIETRQAISDSSHVARALHAATAACRKTKFGRVQGGEDVLLWANFVHYGA